MSVKIIGNTRIHTRELTQEQIKANQRYRDYRTKVITKMERISRTEYEKLQERTIKGMTTLHSL